MREYLRKVWLGFYTVLLGMKVTIRYFFSPSITLQYPDQKWEIPDGARGKLDVHIDDCIGCLQCARACPVECITIETKKPPPGLDMGKTSDGTKKKLVVPFFDINLTTCLYCGLCVEACPTGCIRMTKDYEYSVYDRGELLLSFGKDLDPAVVAAAEKAAAEKAAAEEAEAEKAGAGKKGADKSVAEKPVGGAVGAAKGTPGEAKAEPGKSGASPTAAKPRSETPKESGAAEPKPAGGGATSDGSANKEKPAEIDEGDKPGVSDSAGKAEESSSDKTPPPLGEKKTSSE
jgi:NADH-quinone oxidoreductase subunit I